MSHSVDDLVLFTGNFWSNKVSDIEDPTKAVLSKISDEFVKQLKKRTELLNLHISNLENQYQTLTTKFNTLQNENKQLTKDKKQLTKEKDDATKERDEAKTELENEKEDATKKYDVEKRKADKELKKKYQDMTKKDEELEAQLAEQMMLIDHFTMKTQELKVQKLQLETQNHALQGTLAEYKKWIDRYSKGGWQQPAPHNYQQGNPFLISV